jgi:hypothetical protein
MNREEALEKMLPSWTKVERIKDFVVVDWSSKKPIIENKIVLEQLNRFENIKIVRVENEKYFYRCQAWNLARKYTDEKNKILLKLDVDYFNLAHRWMDSLFLFQSKDNNFYLNDYFITGSYQFMPYSLGFLLVNKKDFGLGYNENFKPVWGFEDEEIIKRIEKQFVSDWKDRVEVHKGWEGLKRIIFFNMAEYIYHIPHSFKQRVENLQLSEYVLGKGFDITKMWTLAMVNKEIGKRDELWVPSEYKILEESRNYIRVERILNKS